MLWIWRTRRQHDDAVDSLNPPQEFNDLGVDLTAGLPVVAQLPAMAGTVPETQSGRFNDAVAFGPAPAFSDRLKATLLATGVRNIDWHPVTAVRRTERVGYHLANVIGRIACVDLSRSELQRLDDGRIEFIDRLALTEPDGAPLLFRLAEFLPLIIVQDPVKVAVEKSGCTGVEFWHPSDFVL